MLITPTIQFIGMRRVRVSWIGAAGQVAWVYVNGVLYGTPRYFEEVARYVELNVPELFAIEVHECAEDEVPAPIRPGFVQRPTLWWSPRDGASRYVVYRRASPEGTETVLALVNHQPGRTHYEYRPLVDLRQDGDVWNMFRVEAVSARGVESVRESWPFQIPGLPPRIAAVDITGSGGVFTLALEAA